MLLSGSGHMHSSRTTPFVHRPLPRHRPGAGTSDPSGHLRDRTSDLSFTRRTCGPQPHSSLAPAPATLTPRAPPLLTRAKPGTARQSLRPHSYPLSDAPAQELGQLQDEIARSQELVRQKGELIEALANVSKLVQGVGRRL